MTEHPAAAGLYLHEAGHLVVGSDVMAAVVLGASVAAWLAVGWLQARAAAPTATSEQCLRAVPATLNGALTPRRTHGIQWHANATTQALVPVGLRAACQSVGLRVVSPMAVLGGMYLALSGHLPRGRALLVLAIITAATLTGLWHVSRQVRAVQKRGSWMAARGPHLTLARAAGEVLLVGAVVLAASALSHTDGRTVSSAEVAAAAIAGRAVSLLRVPPHGLLLADVSMAVWLVSAQLSPAAAIGTVAIWRAGMFVARLAATQPNLRKLCRARSTSTARETAGPSGRVSFMAVDGQPLAELSLSLVPTGSAAGEWLHRLAFRAVSVLPTGVAAPVRRRVFEALFTAAPDPWRYDELAYEGRKRDLLVARVVPLARTIVEVGCADGHNLAAIAAAHPATRVIGLDISPTAVRAATERTRSLPNVQVAVSDLPHALQTLRELGVGEVDLLVLSEVLYYVGGPGQVRRELSALRPALDPSATVVLLHPVADGDRLHPAAVAALGCTTVRRDVMEDPVRPFVIEVARPSWRPDAQAATDRVVTDRALARCPSPDCLGDAVARPPVPGTVSGCSCPGGK
jgi:hypothetical protein